ncbi:hypothetical protein EVAR_13851_1 [Eumeta japonica]|uniref:Uncharacterized protein n=1 Tax=Eumeta variegata TaxID=151549 RepID=A0A4C1U1B5_EUMVA|nr:hypothetical protein EVAR_13851_1 [Eumeta japonica]
MLAVEIAVLMCDVWECSWQGIGEAATKVGKGVLRWARSYGMANEGRLTKTMHIENSKTDAVLRQRRGRLWARGVADARKCKLRPEFASPAGEPVECYFNTISRCLALALSTLLFSTQTRARVASQFIESALRYDSRISVQSLEDYHDAEEATAAKQLQDSLQLRRLANLIRS